MCRSIKTLRRPAPPASDEEIRAAALQYVRKISGCRAPSKANRAAFEQAVEAIATTTTALLTQLPPPPEKPFTPKPWRLLKYRHPKGLADP
jgi:hypothetical protein